MIFLMYAFTTIFHFVFLIRLSASKYYLQTPYVIVHDILVVRLDLTRRFSYFSDFGVLFRNNSSEKCSSFSPMPSLLQCGYASMHNK